VLGPGPLHIMRMSRAAGFSLLEVLFTVAISATLVGIAVPLTSGALDEIRTAGAARYMAGRISAARIDAVRRSTTVALRFEPTGGDYLITLHADGNGNGVRTMEIGSGVDLTLGSGSRLEHHAPGVRFGLLPGIADLDGGSGSREGVRVGAARILSLAATGGATSGTLYLHGRRAQYAVRVLGATGRVRVFHYDPGARRWNN
jgi:prepilin-type N-terminal cleavage/methylation domain-containing protein